MNRTIITAALGALGALTVAISAYFAWVNDRVATDLPLAGLVQTDITAVPDSYWVSFAAPLAIVGAIGILAGAVRSRAGLAVGWLLGSMTVMLWFLMRLIESSPTADAGKGMGVALAGLVVMILAVAGMESSRDNEVERSLSVFEGDPPQ
jgi:hypothetical protein